MQRHAVSGLKGAEYRCTPDGRCIVWRTEDAGASWTALTEGLPQTDAHLTVLRDGFTTDGDDPAGLYFGTRSGKLYGSRDEGRSWTLLQEGLPPIVCVKAAVVVKGRAKKRAENIRNRARTRGTRSVRRRRAA